MKDSPRPDGSKIEDLRWAKRLRTTELAQRVGVSRQHMNRIMRGTRGASPEVQEAIAGVLEVPVEEIQETEA